MSQHLLAHIRNHISLRSEEEQEILSYFTPKQFPKKTNIIEANSKCKQHIFVNKGCLRMFFTNTKGVEQTTQFAIENWWITDYQAYANQLQTDFCVQTVEDSDVMLITHEQEEALLNRFPKFERYFRLIYQRAYAASQIHMKYLHDLSRRDLYLQFDAAFPEFTRRVPQYMLASFMNMTPEYLSEIKRKAKMA